MVDPDGGDWVHWTLFNIPSETSSLPEAVNGPEIGVTAVNSFGMPGWGGPCPPLGTHRYVFTLYALDEELLLTKNASIVDLQQSMAGHILARAVLTRLYRAP